METVIRVFIIYIFILVGLRILGKREFGQLSPLELVSLLMIPEIVTKALTGEDYSLTNALIGVSTLFSLVFLTSVLMQWSRKAEHIIAGKPAVLVYDGNYVPDNMNRERITPDEIFTEMHKSGLEKLEQVKWAVLEPDGKISIVPAEHVLLSTQKHPREELPL
jgi:uncharacterized membrane protein YcaP (DUF421 family)